MAQLLYCFVGGDTQKVGREFRGYFLTLIISVVPYGTMAVSLKMIATELGVSREAVSHVLNGREHKVSQATRDAVRAALKRYDYQTNSLVQALRNKRTNTVGVIVPDICVSVFPEIISAIELAAMEKEYQVLITQMHSKADVLDKQVALLRQKRVDGLVIFPVSSHEQVDLYRKLIDADMPFVTFLRYLNDLTLPYVGNDECEIGRLATQHLLDLGHRRIACLRGYPGARDAHQRAEGYCQALREAGIAVDNRLIAGDNFTLESGERATDDLLSRKVDFTAIVASSDLVAVGAIRRLWSAGLRIPQDVSVVGLGNLDVGRYFNPPLTTIDQKPEELGRRCFHMLMERINDSKGPVKEDIVRPELIVRQSTAALRG